MDEGYIKFNGHWIRAEPLPTVLLEGLNAWRQKLHELGLVGMYDDGIGFGNLSIRHPGKGFIITGSATGGLQSLDEQHYVLVSDYNLQQNSLVCKGPIMASSESLSHAVIYEASPATRAIIHVHHKEMWARLMDQVPTTRPDVSYGTPAMAREILRLFSESELEKEKILVMGGHPEGILAFGHSLDEAGNLLLRLLQSIA